MTPPRPSNYEVWRIAGDVATREPGTYTAPGVAARAMEQAGAGAVVLRDGAPVLQHAGTSREQLVRLRRALVRTRAPRPATMALEPVPPPVVIPLVPLAFGGWRPAPMEIAARDPFRCVPLGRTLAVGTCVGHQVAARDTGGAAAPACLQCPLGLEVARRYGVEFQPVPQSTATEQE